MESLREAIQDLIKFRDERDWSQFHTPRNLAAAIAIEAGELQEALLWKTDQEVKEFIGGDEGKEAVRRELADILIFTLLFCHDVGLDPIAAVQAKLTENAAKYPVDLARGSAAKYTQLRQTEDED